MNPLWTEAAWEDYLHWQRTDRGTAHKINDLIEDARRAPFKGRGKPEPLKESLKGWWSRRITGERRLVYRVVGKDRDRQLEFVQCRYHY